MASRSPQSLIIRTYQVGFGDCFLLSFKYASGDRHVLIDFGSTGLPKNGSVGLMRKVAKAIENDCGKKLHAVVATHRHKDHISGFATSKKKNGTGDLIASLKPDIVIQPWTENPKLKRDATGPGKTKAPAGGKRLYVSSLSELQEFTEFALDNLNAFSGMIESSLLNELTFVGDDNLKNRSAIDNLITMGKNGKGRYVYFGSKSGLEKILPGVKVSVLGPPTLQQSKEIKSQRAKDPNEFWQLRQLQEFGPGSGHRRRLFKSARIAKNPIYARWFREQAARVHAESLLSMVRILDDAMNNTSVILLFEVAGKAFLFPGDAQIENWSYALKKKAICNRLKKVKVYKVGHHGSLNATPKASLWPLIAGARKTANPQLVTLLSTLAGKHGNKSRGTEVPRQLLLKELEEKSQLTATNTFKAGELRRPVTISLRSRKRK